MKESLRWPGLEEGGGGGGGRIGYMGTCHSHTIHTDIDSRNSQPAPAEGLETLGA